MTNTLEMPEDKRVAFRDSLFRVARRVVVSDYDLREPINETCSKAGLALAGPVTAGPGVQAVEVRPC